MTEETQATLDARAAPNPPRAAALLQALNKALEAFAPLVSADMGCVIELGITAKPKGTQ